MSALQLVLKQRPALLRALCCGGTSEPFECVLDLLLSRGILVWEDYQSVQIPTRPLTSNVRDLLDLVYTKGEEACSLLLAAVGQVLPEAQKADLSFGKFSSMILDSRGPSTRSIQTLLADRPALVQNCREHIDGALEVLLETGCLSTKDCDEIQLPVYTPSQQVRRLLDQVAFKGEHAVQTLLQYLDQVQVTSGASQKKEKQLSAECLQYQKKLQSSILAQSHFLSTYGGTGRFSLDDIYTDGLLELAQDCGKSPVTLSLEDVLGLVGTLNEEADTVLISGKAGSGKSTLLQRLHLLWARGTFLTDILLVFPFSCRKLNTERRKLSLKELLFLHCCWPDCGQDQIFQFILDHPNLVLFTFDGLDEFKHSFSDEERHCCPTQPASVHMLLFNLLQGSLMKGVRKVVTSRTWAVGPALMRYLRKEVLLKGFSPRGIECFVRKHHNDPSMADRVLESLQSNTALLGLCHVPVLCWIVSKCSKELLDCDKGSPQTITDVYLMILQHFFHRQNLQVQGTLRAGWLKEHFDTVMHLGQLALEGLETSCYVFSGADLQRSKVTQKDVSMGFLIVSEGFTDASNCNCYEFLHITLQCFFAALYIVLSDSIDKSTILKLFQSSCKQESSLRKVCLKHCLESSLENRTLTGETPNLQITAKFVSGLLSHHHRDFLLQSCVPQTFEWKTKQVTKCLSKGIQKHFKSIPKPVEGEKKSMHAMPGFMWLIKCIYEMQESSIAKGAVAKLEVEHLKLTYCNIGPVECTALAYVLQHLRTPVGFQLDYNSVGDVGVEQLLPCLHTCHSLYLRNNNISDEGVRKIVERGIHCDNFKKIALFNNRLTDVSTQYFAHLLKTKQNFLSLRLGNNSITSEGAEQLAEGLRNSQSLQYLGLWGNEIEDKGAEALANALQDSTTLLWLSLVDNGVGNAGARALAELVKKTRTLEELWLSKNRIGRDGVDCLIHALKMNSSIKSVWLRGNNLSPEDVEELTKQESRLTF
ncbi:nucleotide-binding oligomerization domain-containing protein 2 [Chanos chanos]|uniref:Nucleotide-binding oligomerization domain-containing protein 2 n=1 Tax=Chanos chanos TaxID=29144 RepID=A0A6J2UNS2_CHACN|nr:nucleotide-binding oligomerization domain-containing protein 2 [Chanos chanos]